MTKNKVKEKVDTANVSIQSIQIRLFILFILGFFFLNYWLLLIARTARLFLFLSDHKRVYSSPQQLETDLWCISEYHF